MMNKTYSAKPLDVSRKWYVIDASDNSLGRIASAAAVLLLGKDKPMFTKHIDCGDYVVIVNSANLKVTGNKLLDKKYYHHSQHPGGLRTRTLEEQMQRDPNKVIYHAIRGMLPNNKLLDDRLNRLNIFTGNEHHHEAQQPIKLDLTKGENS